MHVAVFLACALLACIVLLARREPFDALETAEKTVLPALPPTATPPAGAIVGKRLADFRFEESRVYPPGRAREIQNITQVQSGIFKHTLRMGNGWHDGDRDLTTGKYREKGRAELCCLGGNTPFRRGDTWLIGSTLMFDKNFEPSRGFCQAAQPVLHQSYFNWSLDGDTMVGQLMVFEKGLGSRARLVREVRVKRGEWVTWTLKVTFAKKGYYGLSVNGDNFKGFSLNTEVGHTRGNNVGIVKAFGGTWGLYCKMSGRPRELTVYHAYPFIKKL